jgi:hypothetical protein
MTPHEVHLTLTIEPIAPDSAEDVEDQVRAAMNEALRIQSPSITSTVSFERRAPITSAAAAIVTAIRLVFKDVPELVSSLKTILNKLSERFKDSNVIDATLKVDQHTITLKGPDDKSVELRLGDEFELKYAPARKKRTKKTT